MEKNLITHETNDQYVYRNGQTTTKKTTAKIDRTRLFFLFFFLKQQQQQQRLNESKITKQLLLYMTT